MLGNLFIHIIEIVFYNIDKNKTSVNVCSVPLYKKHKIKVEKNNK